MSIFSSREKRGKVRNRYISSDSPPLSGKSSRSRLAPAGAAPQAAAIPTQDSGLFRPVGGRADIRRLGAWFCTLGCAALLCGSLGFGLHRAYRFCTTSDFLRVSRIDIQGLNQLKPEEILNISGLKEGDNCLSVRIAEMEAKLLQNPWIEAVSIRRELPDAFVINVTERVPQFWVLRNGTLHYLDQNGLLIAPVRSENFRSLPTLDIGPGGEDAVPHLGAFMTQLKAKGLPFDLAQISWLRISAGKGFELYWENKHLSLSIGIENWQENLKRLAMVIADMEKRKEINKTREIYAADGQVWLHKA